MMTINLLPWREQIREQRKKEFVGLLFLAAIIGVVIIIISYFPVAHLIGSQQQRIDYLQQAITQEKNNLDALKTVTAQKKQIVEQINLIQGLQNDRFRLVQLLDLLVRMVPNDAYLTRIEQQNNEILLEGRAITNAPITELIKNLNNAHLFKNISLSEIKEVGNSGEERSFSLLLVEQQTDHVVVGKK